MEGWVQRLFTLMVLAAIALVAAFAALWIGAPWQAVLVMALTLFVAMAAIQIVTETRRDVKVLKTQAMELSGYEGEIGRRVDHLASLVQRAGGAAPDELAKRLRAVGHEYTDLARRIERLEEDVAELSIAPRASSAGETSAAPAPADEARETAAVIPLHPAAASQEAPAERTPEPAREPARTAVRVPVPRPGTSRPGTPQPVAKEAVVAKEAATIVAAPSGTAGSEPARAPDPKAERPPLPPRPDPAEAAALRRLIASDALMFHLGPIVALPERAPVLYEAQMRLRMEDGTWTENRTLIERAEPLGLAPLIERKTLYTAARMLRAVRRLGKDMRLVAPLALPSLKDERGFAELRQFLQVAPDLRDGLVLEVSQAAFRTLPSEARQRIGLVADAGFQLSLGAVRDTNVDPSVLQQLGFTLARADVAALLEPGAGGTSFAVRLAAQRIDLVATGVEREAQLVQLIDRDVMRAQGPALGRPRLVKPELLSPPAPDRQEANRQDAKQPAAREAAG